MRKTNKNPKNKVKYTYTTKVKVSVLLVVCILSLGIGCATSTSPDVTPENKEPGQEADKQKGTGYIRLPKNLGEKYYGFNIYRSTSRSGPFEKVNEDIISAQVTEANQFFKDKNLVHGKTYYYYIEGVNYAGQGEKITPAFRVKPR